MNQMEISNNFKNQVIELYDDKNESPQSLVAVFCVYKHVGNNKRTNSFMEIWAFVGKNGFESLKGKTIHGRTVNNIKANRVSFLKYIELYKDDIKFNSTIHRNNLLFNKSQIGSILLNDNLLTFLEGMGWSHVFDINLKKTLDWNVIQSRRSCWKTEVAEYFYQISVAQSLIKDCRPENEIEFENFGILPEGFDFKQFMHTGYSSTGQKLVVDHCLVQKVVAVSLPPSKKTVPKDHDLRIPAILMLPIVPSHAEI
jgi:hypothetical protein